MCVACIEFIKSNLTLKEFQTALREVTRTDGDHLAEVERLVQATKNDPEVLRKKLTEIKAR